MVHTTNTLALLANELADLEQQVSQLSTRSALIGSGAIIALVIVGALIRDKLPRLKLPIFASIATITLVVTTILIASTIFLNTNSSSKGPVHWHADFEVWACGQQLELRDPTGMISNKIGTSTYHEHNDKRIHLEGVVVTPRDASLGKFFRVIGGELTDRALSVPLNDDQQAYYEDNKPCPVNTPQAGQNGDVQVFAYRAQNNTSPTGKKLYRQEKVADPANFLIRDDAEVPPGDCIIIEFGPTRERTDKKCYQYVVQDDTLGNWEEIQ
jgi:hypothetical protein